MIWKPKDNITFGITEITLKLLATLNIGAGINECAQQFSGSANHAENRRISRYTLKLASGNGAMTEITKWQSNITVLHMKYSLHHFRRCYLSDKCILSSFCLAVSGNRRLVLTQHVSGNRKLVVTQHLKQPLNWFFLILGGLNSKHSAYYSCVMKWCSCDMSLK